MFGFLGDNIDSVKQAAEVGGYPHCPAVGRLCLGMADADSLLQANNTGKDEAKEKERYVAGALRMHHPVVFWGGGRPCTTQTSRAWCPLLAQCLALL